ncbi:sulfurtransferase [Rubrivivax gelatinosus]|uniref:Sulfurtransferase n=1 Tax=Rubrivivax gelatinosus TaxID=28068 RepID=A0ABS1E0Z7_RUBGE|nr:rhodanese-like domain-containing protein [Rubrivivax gelatinosus]MBK1613239.1 sulfurtransferase [Rubrivivax gelatinosus]MBK1714557.1 sulfurtransferase [Rubrivivax gelatinosus]
MQPAHTPAVSRRRLLLSLALASGAFAGSARAAGDEALPLEAARDALASGRAVVIDIREPDEHARGVAPGMRLLPMSQIGQRLAEIPKDPKQPVLLVCNTQNRSRATAQALRERGWSNVRYVAGGMSEWARRGWPLVAPR